MLMLLKEIAERLGGTVIGNSDIEITRVANLSTANEHDISFLSDKKMHQYLSTTQAGAVIVKATDVIDGVKTSFLVLADPYVGFAKVAQIFDTTPRSSDGIHKTAVIDPLAIMDEKEAKAIADKRVQLKQQEALKANVKVTLENLYEKIASDAMKEFKVIIK